MISQNVDEAQNDDFYFVSDLKLSITQLYSISQLLAISNVLEIVKLI